MKNSLEQYKRKLQKLMPRWSGRDVGHTAGRDWYTMLIISLLVGLVMIVLGAVSYRSTHARMSERVDTLPARGLPITEEKIIYTWDLFEKRNSEFQEYMNTVPKAPSLDSVSSNQEIVETSLPEEVLDE